MTGGAEAGGERSTKKEKKDDVAGSLGSVWVVGERD
jgi:hypothetical protein